MADTSYDYSPYFYQSGLNTSVDNRQSYPVSVDSPETNWGLQLSQMLASLGQNQYNWARDEYNKGMKITDQRINDFMKLSGYGQGLAKNLMGRYTDVFQPIMDKYIQQAGTYNSEARQRFNMGRAESTVGQADQAAMDSAQRQLQSFGINPNSGRYQDLILSGRIKDAAARAGAGTKASMDTAQIGRDMTLQAAKMGQNVPGMTVNALNSAYQGVQGAQSALTSMMNTGANLANSASNMLGQSGNANKVPPTGQVTNRPAGAGSGGGFNTKPEGGDKGGGGRGGGQPSGGKGMWNEPPGQGGKGNQGGGGARPAQQTIGRQPGQKSMGVDEEDQGTGEKVATPGFDPSLAEQLGFAGPNNVLGNNPNTAFGDPTAGDIIPPGWENRSPLPNENPLTGQEFPPTTGFRDPNSTIDPRNGTGEQVGGEDTYSEDPGYDFAFPGMDQGGGQPEERLMDNGDLGGGEEQGPQQDFGNYGGPDFNESGGGDYAQQNFGGYGADQGNYGGGDYGGGGYSDDGGGYGGQYAGDTGGNYGGGGNGNYGGGNYSGGYQGGNNFGDYNFGGYYAKGGSVRPRRGRVPPGGSTGGPVPKNASPSRGRQVDDVPARLNADEFVIPRDVKLHKGTEFFENLIKKSRQARLGTSGPPPKPKMKPALRLKPTFVSRPM